MEMTVDTKGEELVVANASQYIDKINDFEDEDEESAWYSKNSDQVTMIGQIVATEVALFMFRRTAGGGFCASIIDDMMPVRRALITKYEKKYGKWMDFNIELI